MLVDDKARTGLITRVFGSLKIVLATKEFRLDEAAKQSGPDHGPLLSQAVASAALVTPKQRSYQEEGKSVR